jgi:aminopeptidase N
MKRVLAIAVLWVGLVSPLSFADNYPRQPGIDVQHYVFELTLSDETDEIVGKTTVEIRFVANGVTEIELDLTGTTEDPANGAVAGVHAGTPPGESAPQAPTSQAPGMTVTGVFAGDEMLAFSHSGNRLRIPLPAPSVAGEMRRFTIEYRGVPATGLIIGDTKYGDRSFFSDNWPNKARNWLPTVDHPYDKATSEMIVTAPSHYQVISNGLLIEETDLPGGVRLTHWKQSVPIATWLYVLGAARFAVQYVDEYEGRSIQTWVYAQDRDAGFYDFAIPTKQVLEFYGDYVGPFSYEKLANVQSNSVGGGMEAATAIFYGDNSVTGDRSVRWRNVVIHEIAHQWFGNAVTESDWDDVWLSEGFATYFTSLFIEHAYGRDEFVQQMNNAKQRVYSFYADRPEYRIVHDNLSDMSQVTTGMQYQKGAWVLHMLRHMVGDELFWEGIRQYYGEYQDKNATTADFQRVMEEVSGMEIGWFLQQWLQQGGNPRYQGGWSYDPGSGELTVELDQIQDGPYEFSMPVDLGIYFEDERQPRIEVLQVEERENEFILALGREPSAVVLDPDTWMLMEADFERR